MGYKYTFMPTFKETELYGLCIHTGENTKWKKWYKEEKKRIAHQQRRIDAHRIPIIRPKKAKALRSDQDKRQTHYTAAAIDVPEEEEIRRAEEAKEEEELKGKDFVPEEEKFNPDDFKALEADDRSKKMWRIIWIVALVVLLGAVRELIR